ncbi:hypothetical protein J437_LFUL018285 [Ladona fulva]|uniref:Uncharacterized protein n=1 Tax=Ladona fulva TaxID=123851 RepID=A0A8K0KCC8_LADFU|nr:hypothetical protein J437_LFUL018285 [Ladona fulva]
MPTNDHEDYEVEEVKKDRVVVMGDWNASVGNEQVGGIVGNYGTGGTDERSRRLIEFCRDRKMIIMNTWFKHHKRKLYT